MATRISQINALQPEPIRIALMQIKRLNTHLVE